MMMMMTMVTSVMINHKVQRDHHGHQQLIKLFGSHVDLRSIFCVLSAISLLRSVQWLPVGFRILFKINLLTYQTMREKQPVYLHSMLAASIPSRSLKSNNDTSLSVPRVKTNTGARAFHSWNNLPLSVRSASSVATFKKYLKTHLFDLAFSP